MGFRICLLRPNSLSRPPPCTRGDSLAARGRMEPYLIRGQENSLAAGVGYRDSVKIAYPQRGLVWTMKPRFNDQDWPDVFCNMPRLFQMA